MMRRTRAVLFISAAVAGAAVAACVHALRTGTTVPLGSDQLIALPGYPDRPVRLHLPPGSKAKPLPLVVVFHGGGGNADGALRLTCPGGEVASPDCLDALADREGFAVAYPNGTGSRLLARLRTWNAGGGQGEWQCVSGNACREGVDDIAYVKVLLDRLEATFPVDTARLFATGISNGGAMSHRVACELADRFAAVASVGGGNQLATGAACTPARPISVMEIHGTEDPCWLYGGGVAACLQNDQKSKVSVAATMSGWREREACGKDPARSDLPDRDPSDGTTTKVDRWSGCQGGAELELWTVEHGGHTWPGGWQYFGEPRVGRTARDFKANEAIWAFFQRHPANG